MASIITPIREGGHVKEDAMEFNSFKDAERFIHKVYRRNKSLLMEGKNNGISIYPRIGIRKIIKDHKKRYGADFLEEVNRFVYEKVLSGCSVFNGHKKTLDASVARHVLGIK